MWSIGKLPRMPGLMRKRLGCSFCGRKAAEVNRLIAGGAAYICDTCVVECVTVLTDNGGFDTERPQRPA